MVNGAKFIKDFQLTFDGANFEGKVKNFAPVSIQNEVENIRAGGMEGVIPVRVGLQPIEFSFTVYGYEEGLLVRSGLHQGGANTEFTMNWVIEDQEGTKTSVIVSGVGMVTSIDRGSIENGQLNETTVNMTLTAYTEEYEGEVIFGVDVYNSSRVNIIGGIDVARDTINILRSVGVTSI